MTDTMRQLAIRHMRSKGCEYYKQTECANCVRQGLHWTYPECRGQIECLVGSFITMEEPNPIYVAGVIRREELKAIALFDRAPKTVSRFIERLRGKPLDGAALFKLHATHGLDPSIVESVTGTIPQNIHAEYRDAMEAHRQTSKGGKTR